MKVKRIVLAAALLLLIAGLSGCALTTVAGQLLSTSFEVRYELNGGTLISGDLYQEVEKGADAVDPKVERAGFKFSGWDKPSANVRSDLTIVAQWEKGYKIEFDPDGGTLTSGSAVQYLTDGDLPEAPTAVMEGMEFAGWSPELAPVSGDADYKALWTRVSLGAEAVYEKVKSSVVEIAIFDEDGDPESLGSGFFIDDRGTVLTNYHVIEGAYSATVTTSGNKQYDVENVLGYDKTLDLALIQVDVTGNDYLTIATVPVNTGETVYAMGSPRGQTGTFTTGTVSNASTWTQEGDVDYIQHQAPISSGNSGGPLLNSFGEVVGVNTMIMLDAQNMNYAVNISQLDLLDRNNKISMLTFYQQTNADYLWLDQVSDFVKPASASEEESNDQWLSSDKLTFGTWTAAAITDENDVDWFYIQVETPGRLTFEVVPNRTNEAKELIGMVASYTGNTQGDSPDVEGVLHESSSYSYTVENVCTIDAELPGLYFVAVTHDDDYAFGNPYVYLVRVS